MYLCRLFRLAISISTTKPPVPSPPKQVTINHHRNTHNARFSSTLAMYGHSPVIEPFVCGLHMLGVPLPNYFSPWPRQIESHPPVVLQYQHFAKRAPRRAQFLLDPAPRKLITVYDAHNVIVFILTSFFLSSRGFFLLFTEANDRLQLVETIEASRCGPEDSMKRALCVFKNVLRNASQLSIARDTFE